MKKLIRSAVITALLTMSFGATANGCGERAIYDYCAATMVVVMGKSTTEGEEKTGTKFYNDWMEMEIMGYWSELPVEESKQIEVMKAALDNFSLDNVKACLGRVDDALSILSKAVAPYCSSTPEAKKPDSSPKGKWVASGSDTRRYLSLNSEQVDGGSDSRLQISCTSSGMNVEVTWNTPIKNIYPSASVPAANRIMVQFGQSSAWETGWHPSSKGYVTSAPGVQLDLASGIDSAIFSLLGMDNISKRNKEMFDWTAEQFVSRIAQQADPSSQDNYLILRTRGANNAQVNSIYDLTGFNSQANKYFKGVCTR